MNYWVVGYYGYGNTGDDDLLNQTLRLIRATDNEATIRVAFPATPRSPLPDGVIATSRFSTHEIVSALRQSDLIVFGGGGIFQDQTSLKSLIYYVSLVFGARLFGLPVVLLGQGISRPKRLISRQLIRWALSQCSWIGCRDNDSLMELRRLTDTTKGILTADLAFANRSPQIHSIHRPYIALSIRKPNHELNWAPIAHFITNSPLPILGLSFESPGDDAAIKSAFDSAQIPYPTITSLQHNFPRTSLSDGVPELVVAMRYHACVWAALNGTPFLALAYDDKVISIANELGQPVIDLRAPNSDSEITTAVAIALQNHTALKQQILQYLPRLTQLADRNRDGLLTGIGH